MKEEATIADFEIWKDQPNSLEKVATIECNLLLNGPGVGHGRRQHLFVTMSRADERERERDPVFVWNSLPSVLKKPLRG